MGSKKQNRREFLKSGAAIAGGAAIGAASKSAEVARVQHAHLRHLVW